MSLTGMRAAGRRFGYMKFMGPVMDKILSLCSKLGPCCSLLENGRQISGFSRRSNKLINKLSKLKPASGLNFQGRNAVIIPTIGQPTPLTHPHRLLEGEIVPGIKEEEFQSRRHKLVESIEKGSGRNKLANRPQLIIIPASSTKYMTEKIPYVFRQNSDFLYLTGCMEPDCILVITNPSRGKQEDILFMRGKNPKDELWHGPRTGVDEAVEFFKVDKCFPVSDFTSFLLSYVKEHSGSVLWYDYANEIQPFVHQVMKQYLSETWYSTLESPRAHIHELRLYKSEAEQELMKKTCLIGSKAHKSTIENSKPGDNEAHIFARVDYECRMNGAEYLAYPPVVAGGERANIIHYINNDQVVRDGELVLMDAGSECHGYSSDITRTWPISGKFSPAQRVLYEVVYSLQEDLIKMCTKSSTLLGLYLSMNEMLTDRLFEAGIVPSRFRSGDTYKLSRLFCPHNVGHYLGMDIHDTMLISGSTPIKPGMVFTIEPGVYIQPKCKVANPEFLGLGIRIEDDILMTSDGPLVLTSFCPKHPDEIEKLAEKRS